MYGSNDICLSYDGNMGKDAGGIGVMEEFGRSIHHFSKSSRLSYLRRASLISGAVLAGILPGIVIISYGRPAVADTSSTITFSGYGWGHGRGEGQWGTLGYALQGGLNANEILSHYYSNTTFGQTPNVNIRIILTANSGSDIVVTSQSPFSIAGYNFGANAQARMHSYGNGTWEIDVSTTTTGCSSNPSWTMLGTTSEASAIASPNTASYSTENFSNALGLCISGSPNYYRGQIAAADYQGSPRTLNIVDEEDYLRGVVPAESPAYWGTLGSTVATQSSAGNQPSGFFALMAQAVESRSYALSSMGEFGFADICDSSYCQVYNGMQAENPISDLAVSATAGEVLLLNGSIARTEFSSSTGGYTAGGTFPAVPDNYDSVCVSGACNPNHSWTTQVTLGQLQADFPSVGTITELSVASRNGYGALGGRVTSISVTGTGGTVTMDGEQFGWQVGLNSDWFTFSGSGAILVPDGSSSTANNGYYVDSSVGGVSTIGAAISYGSMVGTPLNKPVVGMASTPDGKGYWLVASDGGIFTFGDAAFEGSMPGIGYTGQVVSMAPSYQGNGYYVLTANGNVYAFGNVPVLQPPTSTIPAIPGNLVGLALGSA